MVLYDKLLKDHMSEWLTPFDDTKLGNISYDLSADVYVNEPHQEKDEVLLLPGESVFVKSAEAIHLPNNVIAHVILRNSRIRQGLSLSAPVYQPGHHTRVYYRISNVSQQTIRLKKGDEIAAIMFEQLDSDVLKPYDGTFQDEMDYSGMGVYASEYKVNMSTFDDKLEAVKNIEKSIYSNVLGIMAVFVAVFSLVNINVTLIAQQISMRSLLTVNLATVGSVAFLLAAINSMLPDSKHPKIIWGACVVAFVAALLLQFI